MHWQRQGECDTEAIDDGASANRLIELVGEYGRDQRETASCTIKRRAIKGR